MDWNAILSIAVGGGVAGLLALAAFARIDKQTLEQEAVLDRLAELDRTVPMSMPRHLRHLD